MKDLTLDNSAWADFLISKAALILVSFVLFTALFQLVAGFKDLEIQEQLDSLAWDFKIAADEIGARSFQGNSQDIQEDSGEEFPAKFYSFSEKELYQALPPDADVKVCISGEYVCLEAEIGEKIFRGVRPFTFKVLPFKETDLHEKFLTRFGMDGSKDGPIIFPYSDIEAFLQKLGAQETVLNPEENITLKKELIYVRDRQGVSAFDCVLIYQ